jgi:aspartyl protease family protein
MGAFVAIALAVAFALALALPGDMTLANVQAGEFVANAAYGLIAVVLAASLIHRYRGRLTTAARDALAWLAIGAVFVALHAYRDRFASVQEHVMAELMPGRIIVSAPDMVEVVKRNDGHFILRMKANGVELPFLFDTGATSVMLRMEDAGRIGVDVGALRFSETISTANGSARAAAIRLKSLAVGGITRVNVATLVAREGALSENLLGQTFLASLDGYGVENGRLVLRGK